IQRIDGARCGIGQALVAVERLPDGVLDGGPEQLLLALEVVVDEGDIDADLSGDVADGDAAEVALGEEIERDRQDRPDASLARAPGAWASGGGRRWRRPRHLPLVRGQRLLADLGEAGARGDRLGVELEVEHGGLAGGQRALEGGGELLRALDALAMGAEGAGIG